MYEVNHNGRKVITYFEPEDKVLTTTIHGLTLGADFDAEAEWEMSKYEGIFLTISIVLVKLLHLVFKYDICKLQDTNFSIKKSFSSSCI